MPEKPVLWVGSSLDDIREFPTDAKREAGYQLNLVQSGLMASDWKAMPSVGRGVYEIRIKTGKAFRVFYVAKFEEGVYVLHAFEKKSQKTKQADIEIGKQRLGEVEQARKRPGRS